MYIRGGHSRNIWRNLQHCRFPPEGQLAERHEYLFINITIINYYYSLVLLIIINNNNK